MSVLTRLAVMTGVLIVATVQAQIITDGTVGPQIALNGVDVQISESLGSRSGNNLFHSFQTFSIGTGRTATFTGASDINNVISRVTGGEVSSIQGNLRSEVGNADFYFVNPAGITFSAEGSVDVPASFHTSTAVELRFADGASFSSDGQLQSSLSIASPESFGFISENSSSIEIYDIDILVGLNSSGNASAGLSLTANNLVLHEMEMYAPESIRITAVGEIDAVVDLHQGSDSTLIGDIDMRDADIGSVPLDLVNNGTAFLDNVDFLNVQAGTINNTDQFGLGSSSFRGEFTSIRADSLAMEGRIEGSSFVEVIISGRLTMENGANIDSSPFINVDAGDIFVQAGDLIIGPGFNTGVLSFNSNQSEDAAGNITVIVDGSTILRDGGQIRASTSNSRPAGNVFFATGNLLIEGGGNRTGIFSESEAPFFPLPAVFGNAGNVEVIVVDSAVIKGGGEISSNALSEGDAGNIRVVADELVIDNSSVTSSTGSNSLDMLASGNAGNVEVTVSGLTSIQNFGRIDSRSSLASTGNAGRVRINSGDLLLDSGSIESDSTSFSVGDSGSVEITVSGSVMLLDGSSIRSDTDGPSPTGTAGSVMVNSESLLVDDSFISSDTRGGGSGEIVVTTAGLTTVRDGRISTDTFADSISDAGDVVVNSGELLMDNGTISSNSSDISTGNAGSVELAVSGLASIQNGSVISSAASGVSNDSGAVIVESAGGVVIYNSTLSTASLEGTAGPININVETLNARSAKITTSTDSPTNNGGNILVNSEVFILEETIIQANAESGSGGTIVINSNAVVPFGNQLNTQLETRIELDDPLLPSSGNVIQAVAPTGVTVPPSINSPELDISGALTGLNSTLGEAPAIAANACSAKQTGAPSSLIEVGRGALPRGAAQRLPVQENIGVGNHVFTQQAKNAGVFFTEHRGLPDNRDTDSDAIGNDQLDCRKI